MLTPAFWIVCGNIFIFIKGNQVKQDVRTCKKDKSTYLSTASLRVNTLHIMHNPLKVFSKPICQSSVNLSTYFK